VELLILLVGHEIKAEQGAAIFLSPFAFTTPQQNGKFPSLFMNTG
jgi:hypothetical protein